jgi:hypothetical protein
MRRIGREALPRSRELLVACPPGCRLKPTGTSACRQRPSSELRKASVWPVIAAPRDRRPESALRVRPGEQDASAETIRDPLIGDPAPHHEARPNIPPRLDGRSSSPSTFVPASCCHGIDEMRIDGSVTVTGLAPPRLDHSPYRLRFRHISIQHNGVVGTQSRALVRSDSRQTPPQS